MVIIRINGRIHAEQAKIVLEGIHNQARTGVIVLPSFCELLNEVPADEEIKVLHQDARVAELEKMLEEQRKVSYTLHRRLCSACSYEPTDGDPYTPPCLACEAGDLFRPKGGGV